MNEPRVPRPASYQVVARRFRPRTFEEVVGQEETVKALSATLESGKVPHAFLFCGSRGVGKTTAARIMARALNCERGPSSRPCGACERCVSILAESDPDVIEMDAASNNGVEDIRALREKAAYAPMRGRRKVYIVDEVHMLSRAAFNAFLKVLEEPPPHVTFVLATTELHKIPDTIRSRCQVHVFRRVSEEAVATRLTQICAAEGIEADPSVLAEIAISCRGGLRDAESELERILPLLAAEGARFTPEEYRRMAGRVGLPKVADAVAAILHGDGKAALAFAAAVLDAGIDERECLGEVLEVLRALLHLRVDGSDTLLVRFEGALRERLVAMVAAAPLEKLEAMIQVVLIGRDRIKHFDDRPLLLETTLLRMMRAGEVPLLRELVDRIESAGAGELSRSAAPQDRTRGGAVPVTTSERSVPSARRTSAPAPGTGPALAPGAVPPLVPTPTQGASPPGAVAPPDGDFPGQLRRAVAEQKPMLKEALRECRVEVAPDGTVVRLCFEGLGRMHRDRLEQEGTRVFLRELVKSLRGGPCAVEFSFGMEKEPAGASPPAEQPSLEKAPEKPPAGRSPVEKASAAERTDERKAPPASPAGEPGPLAEKVRKRFDGRYLDRSDP